MESSEEGRRSLLESPGLENGSIGPYTGDGSVDINGNPILKHHTGNWKACFFILGTECCERLAYYGIAKNLVKYLTEKMHEGNVSAARNASTWQGTCFLTSLIGAVLADSYWGKYKTIAVFSTVYFFGMVTVTLSASVPAFKLAACVRFFFPEAQHAVLFFGLYTIALGAGGIKPCVTAFGADQFDDTDPIEKTRTGSFYNWYYLAINIGCFISGTIIVWVQDNCGWSWGFGIPTVFLGLAVASFFIGTNTFRFRKPGGSPIVRVCQVVVASLRNWNIDLPHDSYLLHESSSTTSAIEGSRKLEHTNGLRFLDRAATVSNLDAKCKTFSNAWRLCTVTQVEELKILVRMFPIWLTSIFFFAVTAQNSSTFLEQGMVLDKNIRGFIVPPASLSTFDIITVIIGVPIYDRILVPTARRFTGKERGFSHLQRIGIGLFLSVLAMIAAALVETKRLEVAKADDLIHQKVAVPMSILWQIPQFSLVGAGEVFTCIGVLEFFYDQSPDAMRSLCTAFALITISIGDYLNSLILTVVAAITSQGDRPGWIPDNLNEGHLDFFFWLIAVLSFLNLLAFAYCGTRYRWKPTSACLQ